MLLLTTIYFRNFTFISHVLDPTMANLSLIFNWIGGSLLALVYIDYHSKANIEFGKKELNLLQIIY
jgi:hypothetical protein